MSAPRPGRPPCSPAALTAALAGLLLPAMTAAEGQPTVTLVTSHGDIEFELAPEEAPATVDNFLRYVDEGFYVGTVFHRVIPEFMIQGGGLDAELQERDTHEPVANESDNDLSNERGTVAMARTADPDSATAQFFINLVDNEHLDGSAQEPGYTVFAEVGAGMDGVAARAEIPTGTRGGHQDVPEETVRIEAVERGD